MEPIEGEEGHVDDVGLFDQDAAARGIAVKGTTEVAEDRAHSVGVRGVWGAGSGWIFAHWIWGGGRKFADL